VTSPITALSDFGARSLLTHAIMAVSFLGAVGAALFLEGQLGLISTVALVNFTAGMWISQSIHSLGSAGSDEYEGVLREVLDRVG